MIFILAHNMDAAKQLATANDVLPKDWRYAGNKDNFYAYMNQVLWLGSDYIEHPNFKDVLEEAKKRCFRIFKVTEVPKYTI